MTKNIFSPRLVCLVVSLTVALTTFTHAATNISAPSKVEGKPTTTDSGLQYWDITVGTGATAVAGKNIKVLYTGWLEDGTRFDSSYTRGRAFEFVLGAGKVIKGWDEGIAGMKVGGKRQLRIPPELAYGDRGFGMSVPPKATLTFDIELLAAAE